MAVLGSLLLPFRHLPFDDSWIDSVPPYFVIGTLPLHLSQQTLIPLLESFGSGAIALWQAALQDLKTPQE